jgi:hypothetical protein
MRFQVFKRVLPRQLLGNQLIAVLVCAGWISTSTAIDYSADAAVSTSVSHNDNLRLVQTNKTAVTRYEMTPVFKLSAISETSVLRLTSTFDFNRYDKSEFNTDDQNIALAFNHQLETSSVGFNAAVIRSSTITSELLTTGRIGDKAERTEQYQFSPNGSYTLNEHNLIQFSASYSKQDYQATGYTGYKNVGAELDWIHIINERMKWVTTATYSDYHSDDLEFDVPGFNIGLPRGYFGKQSYSTRTKNKGLQVGLDYQWSEESVIQARFGRSKNDTTYPVNDPQNICGNSTYLALIRLGLPLGGICTTIPHDNTFLSTAELDWTWRNERQQFSLNTIKSTQPTSNGYSVDALQLSSNWSYQLTELDEVSTNLSLIRNRALGKGNSLQSTAGADRDYGSATLQYQHRIGENWFVNTSYQYSRQKYTEVDYQANSKVISLGIRYQPQQWHWSR